MNLFIDPEIVDVEGRRAAIGRLRQIKCTLPTLSELAAPAAVAGRSFEHIGISGLANIVAAIKQAKHFDYGPNDVVMTVATDSAALYRSEKDSYLARHYPGGFDEINAGEIFGRCVDGIADDHLLELRHLDRKRIFNLGYYTWVEQQGVALDDFERRRGQDFWRSAVDSIPAWDQLVDTFNAEIGAGA